jgi:hypothetical protein
MAIKLGTEVTDSYTGFKGIARSRAVFLSGCVRVCVLPKELKDGLRQDHDWLDETDLVENTEPAPEPHFLLGKPATDSISGFSGIVTAYVDHMRAETRISLTPKGLTKEGLPILSMDFDESQIKEVIAAHKAAAKATGNKAMKVNGGPAPSASSARRRDRVPSR